MYSPHYHVCVTCGIWCVSIIFCVIRPSHLVNSSNECKRIFVVLCVFVVVAFLIALNQNVELLGKNGLLPVNLYLNRLKDHFKVRLEK